MIAHLKKHQIMIWVAGKFKLFVAQIDTAVLATGKMRLLDRIID